MTDRHWPRRAEGRLGATGGDTANAGKAVKRTSRWHAVAHIFAPLCNGPVHLKNASVGFHVISSYRSSTSSRLHPGRAATTVARGSSPAPEHTRVSWSCCCWGALAIESVRLHQRRCCHPCPLSSAVPFGAIRQGIPERRVLAHAVRPVAALSRGCSSRRRRRQPSPTRCPPRTAACSGCRPPSHSRPLH